MNRINLLPLAHSISPATSPPSGSPNLGLTYTLDCDLFPASVFTCIGIRHFSLHRIFLHNPDLNRVLIFDHIRDLFLDLDQALDQAPYPAFKKSLQALKDKLPSIENQDRLRDWEIENGPLWVEELRTVMIHQHRDAWQNFQLSPEQQTLLQQYYDANTLLVDCLNSDCYVSREVRQKIEAGLLLPDASRP